MCGRWVVLCGCSIMLCCTRRAAASRPCSQYISVTGSDKSMFVTHAMLVCFRACGRAFTRIILFCETASHLVLSQRMLLWSVKPCTASHVLPSGCAACCDCVFVDSPIRPAHAKRHPVNRTGHCRTGLILPTPQHAIVHATQTLRPTHSFKSRGRLGPRIGVRFHRARVAVAPRLRKHCSQAIGQTVHHGVVRTSLWNATRVASFSSLVCMRVVE
jgi:hypothetical protein